jgi:catechol 2,3-dioxygenase-like lactoylglutathione lyase family enzyme
VDDVAPRTLDHVALWVANRDAIADYVVAHLGMHVIERTDRFTLLGADARRGKLTLFETEGPRERGALKHIALRGREAPEGVHHLGEGLEIRVVRSETDVDSDLDSIALYASEPEATARAYVALGFDEAPARDGVPRVGIGRAFVEFHPGPVGQTERPLLNHVGVLVDRADDARELGLEVADVVDAPNTYAVFVWGPDGVKLEYIEHKPTFSLV